jgi:hypothetical protein
LRTIVGPFQARGFSGPGHINFDGLYGGRRGTSDLMGLRFEAVDHNSSVAVTTRALLVAWLFDVRRPRRLPPDPITALDSQDTNTFALGTDSAVLPYAPIQVADASRLGVVKAMLFDDRADTAFRKCYGERVPRDPAFQRIVTQAEVLVAALPSR